jgi:hypothetical protein
MVRVKERTIDSYIERLERHLLRRFPHLTFRVVKWSEREATIYYAPYIEEEDWPIIRRSGGISTDALVDAGYRLYVMPDSQAS